MSQKEGGVLANADRADKGGGGVGEMLTMADKGGGGVWPPPIFGWHNLWTAPKRHLFIFYSAWLCALMDYLAAAETYLCSNENERR